MIWRILTLFFGLFLLFELSPFYFCECFFPTVAAKSAAVGVYVYTQF